MQNVYLCGAAALIASASLAGATTTIVDFDTDGNGNPLAAGVGFTGAEYASVGVMISVVSPNGSPLNLFNTDINPASGGDGDLRTGAAFGTAPQGLVLIAQDVGVPLSNPDDDEGGAAFVFDFTNPLGVNMVSIGILDLDEPGVPNFSADGFGASPDSINLVNPAFTGNNSLRVYTFSFNGPISQFVVDIPSASGAITFLEFQVVPAPTSAGLLAFAGLAAARRRR